MHILIAERLKPFVHNLKAQAILPGSPLFVEVYPSLILVYSLLKNEPELVSKIETSIKGPIEKFTVQLNLEKGYLLIFGEGNSSYFRYRLSSSLDGKELFFHVEKEKNSALTFNQVLGDLKLYNKLNPNSLVSHERLSLGNHKQQDFTLIKRRQDLKEILPIWLKAGGFYEEQEKLKNEGTLSLLNEIEKQIELGKLDSLVNLFKTAFNVSFDDILVPSLKDLTHQGLNLPKVTAKISPLLLLSYGKKVIRSLFIRYQKNELHLLPALLKEFHSGRFLHVTLKDLGVVDLEWSKKMMRRMILSVDKSSTLNLKLPSEIKRFRLSSSLSTPLWIKAKSSFQLEKGITYFFDRFEK